MSLDEAVGRSFEIVVPPGKVRERLDVFLTHQVENATRSKVHRAIIERRILVDGKKVKPSHKVSPGEIVRIELLGTPVPKVDPENIPLDIVYEDDSLIVVNKPAGMVTHPAYANYSGTLVNALLFHSGGRLSSGGSDPVSKKLTRPGIVHRLDKDTSGLLVIAKDEVSHAILAKQFSSRTIDREYWALVWGIFRMKKGKIEASLGRSKSDRKKIAVSASGKHAVTEYEVLDDFKYLSLVKLKLHTGRTHQIRVHLHHIDHPVFGDPTYGGRKIAWSKAGVKISKEEVDDLLALIGRQALHAKTIGFVHPVTKKKMFFTSELPGDFQAVLSRLGK